MTIIVFLQRRAHRLRQKRQRDLRLQFSGKGFFERAEVNHAGKDGARAYEVAYVA